MANAAAGKARAEAPEPRRGTRRDEEQYLGLIGERVRTYRVRRGMSRRVLAQDSHVSERYLAELERGAGNASLLVLREIARALSVPVSDLVSDRPDRPLELELVHLQLEKLAAEDVAAVQSFIAERLGRASRQQGRIALVGLRGAGKTTLGALAASSMGLPFIELDREIERRSGMDLSEIFASEGQPGFRRRERECLEEIVRGTDKAIIAAGGSLVTEPATYELLLSTCFVVWLKAAPEEHMARVAAQGDFRPMQASQQAMDDLKAILESRRALYGRADATLDTSALSTEAAAERLVMLATSARVGA